MIHPNDEQSIQRMTRRSEIPPHVRDVVERCTQAFHRDGSQGQLGAQVLLPLLAILDCLPPAQSDVPVYSIWHDMPAGTRIEAYYFGAWNPGTYQGMGPGGVLAIKLDSDAAVREARPHMVRQVGVVHPLASPPQAAASDVDLEISGQSAEALELAREATQAPASESAKEFDWLRVMEGEPVLVDDNGGIEKATFHKIGRTNATGTETLLVQFSGDDAPREVASRLVALAN